MQRGDGVGELDLDQLQREIGELRAELEASRRREEALHERTRTQAERSRERLLNAVEAIGDGFALFDADERVVLKNSKMAELSRNLELQFKVGDRLEDIARRLCEEGHFAEFEGVPARDLETMIAQRLEFHRNAPSTHEQRYDNGRWVLVTTRATGDGGRVVAYTDITEQKRAEEAEREKQRLERDLEIARDIQQSLLPREDPIVPGFDIAGWNRPADRTGGDFFDWLPLPSGELGFGLADVTGHGIGPALIVAICRAYIRASAMVDADLERLFGRVNDLLTEDLTEGRFVTAAMGILDPSNARVRLFSAGHGPSFLFRIEDATVEVIEADDIPLGILSGRSGGEPREIELRSGDALILITDGFHEWFSRAGEPFGIGRLVDMVERHHELGARELIDQLYQAVTQFGAGVSQADDLTAVVVKRR